MSECLKMIGYLDHYDGWEKNVIERCEAFFEKNKRWPDFIGMTQKSCDEIYDAMEAFADEAEADGTIEEAGGDAVNTPAETYEDDADYMLVETDESEVFEIPPFEPDELICYPVYFGPVEGRKLAFVTNKFRLYFYAIIGLPDQYFYVQFGAPPDGDNDDDEKETENTDQPFKLIHVA